MEQIKKYKNTKTKKCNVEIPLHDNKSSMKEVVRSKRLKVGTRKGNYMKVMKR